MGNVTLKMVTNPIKDWQESLLSRERAVQSFIVRVLYPYYKKLQIERWKSENSSQGENWRPISKKWIDIKTKDKQKDPSGFPGGSAILIHSSTLFKSVTGLDQTYHRAEFTNTSMKIATTLDYAKWVAQDRPFMNFSDDSIDEMKKKFTDWWIKGKE